MFNNSSSLDARLATQMGIREIPGKDGRPSEIQAVGNENSIRHGHGIFATKEGLYNRFHLNAAQIQGFLIGCVAEAMIIVIFSVIN
jgi:tetrahydromethanopterin S-methyltransferase subunit F